DLRRDLDGGCADGRARQRFARRWTGDPAAAVTAAAAALSARASATARNDAVDTPELQGRRRRAAETSGRRRLVDGAAHLLRVGIQPARTDHARQRHAVAAGLVVLD